MRRSVMLTVVCCLLGNILFGQNHPKISDRLIQMLDNSNQTEFEAIIILEAELDLFSLDAEFRITRPTVKERIQKMIPMMKTHAADSQKDLLDLMIRDLKISEDKIKPFWISNIISVSANKEELEAIATREEVRIVDWNSPILLEEYSCEEPDATVIESLVAPGNHEIGLSRINATAMWELGYTGAGTTVFSADTGIEAFHPSYINRWRGLYQDQSISWYDGPGNNSIPEHCGDHGMHTLGTMVGLDRFTKDTIGVAFNANWIGGATICGGNQTNNIGAFQWALDPDNDLSTVDDMPTVINNSWWDPSIQGQDCQSFYVDALLALEMAGVSVIFSAGNNGGAGVSSITAPKNINLTEVNSFAVANVNGASPSLTAAFSSSQGPSICGGEGSILIKPEVSAPGSQVRSAELGRTYGLKTGTSMAAPHVSGAICLLKEAFPDLLGEDLKTALYLSARDLGDVGEDNLYGMGIIDVKAAYDYLVEEGFTPVPPSEGLDLIGVDSDLQRGYCGDEIVLTYRIMNGGNAPIQSFDYSMRLENLDGSLVLEFEENWTGTFEFNEIIDLDFVISSPPTGDFIAKFYSTAPNGLLDAKPFNNAVGKLVNIQNVPGLEISVNGESAPSVCEGTSVLLSANLETSESYIVEWYGDYQNEELLHRGKEFPTDELTEDLEYFAKAFIQTIGGEDVPAAGEFNSSNGLNFSVLQQTVLKSVDIFAEEAGNRLLKIVNSSGNDVVTKVTNAKEGLNTVIFDYSLDPGNYTMEFLIPKPLLSKIGNVSYPYLVGSKILITGALEEGTYPYFFNWTLETPYECVAQYGIVEVDGINESELDFVINNEEQVYVDEAFEVENLSIGAAQYDWLVDGELVFTDVESPELIIAEDGIHTITCLGINSSGCEVSLSKTISVQLATSLGIIDPNLVFTVFPNPTKEVLNLNFSSTLQGSFHFELIDGLGRRVAIQSELLTNHSYQIPMNELTAGLYYGQLKNESGQLVAIEKILKM